MKGRSQLFSLFFGQVTHTYGVSKNSVKKAKRVLVRLVADMLLLVTVTEQ